MAVRSGVASFLAYVWSADYRELWLCAAGSNFWVCDLKLVLFHLTSGLCHSTAKPIQHVAVKGMVPLPFSPSQTKCFSHFLCAELVWKWSFWSYISRKLTLEESEKLFACEWCEFLCSYKGQDKASVARDETVDFHLQRDDLAVSQSSTFIFPLLFLQFKAIFWLILVGTDHFFCRNS